MSILIQNGRVLDPSQGLDETGHLLIENDKISGFFPKKKTPPKASTVIDAKGLIVSPGFVDMHVHFREPGHEYKETIESGSRAALSGGVTSVACMANTLPANDNASVTRAILREAKRLSLIRVYPVAAATKGLEGKELSEMMDLKRSGAVAISDDGHVIQNAAVARKVMEYAATFSLPVISHAIDRDLEGDGVMNEGWVATELGLPGISTVAEDIMVERDIALARLTGVHLHIAHIASKRAVEAVRRAKKQGLRVTCEATPHHFTLTDEAVRGYETNAKMSPPLRSTEDLEEIWKGLADGTIDAIATDHAPHASHEKESTFCAAPCGIIGLETLLPLSLSLVRKKTMTMSTLIERLSLSPARILGIPAGTLAVGAAADIVMFDPEAIVTVNADFIRSKSKNTPFWGSVLTGKVCMTVVGGVVKYKV